MSTAPNRRTSALVIGAVALAALVIIAVFALRGQGGTNAASGAASGNGVPTTVTVAPIGAASASTQPSTASQPSQPSQTSRRTTTATTQRSSETTTVVTAPNGVAIIVESSLPAQARTTLKLIDDGGPFPYRQDGVVWQNRERRLPSHERGYYHEYTVVTPGSPDRGARRIITGSDGERYYTDDHYGSFRLIVPG